MRVEAMLRTKGRDVLAIAADASLLDAAQLLRSHGIGALLVHDGRGLDGGTLQGIVSERDLVRAMAEHRDAALSLRVRDAMTANVVTCSPTDTTEALMAVMTERRIRHVPVMEDDRVVGIVSIGDVVKRRIGEVSDEARALTEYITLGR